MGNWELTEEVLVARSRRKHNKEGKQMPGQPLPSTDGGPFWVAGGNKSHRFTFCDTRASNNTKDNFIAQATHGFELCGVCTKSGVFFALASKVACSEVDIDH